MTSAVVELNERRSDSRLASKSTLTCNHFSIRGYVADVRKRNQKLCDPFSPYNDSCSDSTEPRYELPPMVVPKFRWWQCDSCVPAGTPAGGPSEIAREEAQNPAGKEGTRVLLIGQTSKIDASRGRNAEASTSSDSNDNRNYNTSSNICVDPKEKGKALVEDELPPRIGYENGILNESSNRGNFQQTTSRIIDQSTDNQVVFRSICNENGTIESHHKNCKSNGMKMGPTEEYVNDEDENVDKTHQGKTSPSSGAQHTDALNNGRLVLLPDLNECNGEHSENDHQEVLINGGNNNLCEEEDDDDDDYLGAEHRKTPKIRLLSELLGLDGNINGAKVNKKNPSFSSYTSMATCKSTGSNPQQESPMNENFKRKSMVSQSEKSNSTEIRGSNKGTKKLRSSDMEISDDSEDESTEIISDTSAKRCRKSTLDKNPLLDKKNKKVKINHEKGKSSEKRVSADVVTMRSSHDVTSQLNIRNAVSIKKKGRMFRVRTPRECTANEKDEEGIQMGSENVQIEPSQDRISRKGINDFPNSHLSAGNDQVHAASVKEPMLLEGGNVIRKNMENRNILGVPFIGSQFDGNREKANCLNSNSKGKKLWICETEEGRPLANHTAMQVSNSVMYQKELTNEARVCIKDIDINSIPKDDKVPEQVPGDDIPMDIVELMAKNQYERHLSDPKDQNYPFPPASSWNNLWSNASDGAKGEDMPKTGQSHFLSLQKPLPINTRNTLVNGFYDMGSSKDILLGPFSQFKTNHFSITGQSGENQISACHNLGLNANKWNSNMKSQRGSPSFVQEMESNNRFRGTSPWLYTDQARGWPSVMANHMPPRTSNPEMISLSANASNKRKIYHPIPSNFNFYDNPGKQRGADYRSKPMRSVDLYSNEAIPAMHLLSLMQNAANMQPPVRSPMGGKAELLKRPPIFTDQQYKQHTINQVGPNSSRQTLPSVRPFSSSLNYNDGFITPIPLTSRGQRKMERSMLCDVSRKTENNVKGITGNPLQDSSNYLYGLGTRRDERTIRPIPEREICRVNQNPSEFNDLKELSRYMIGPKDLRPRGMSRDKSGRPRVLVKKRDMRMNKAIPFGNLRKS